MSLEEKTILAKIEINFLSGVTVFVETHNLILKNDEVISSTPHRKPLSLDEFLTIQNDLVGSVGNFLTEEIKKAVS